MHLDNKQRHWIEHREIEAIIGGIKEEKGQTTTEVKIALPVSHNALTSLEEYIK